MTSTYYVFYFLSLYIYFIFSSRFVKSTNKFTKSNRTNSTFANTISSTPIITTKSTSIEPSQLKIAFCITGQLARLEIISKIKNVIIPNAMKYNSKQNRVDIFVYLDNDIKNIKQTLWNYDYSKDLYVSYNEITLKEYISKQISMYSPPQSNIKVNIFVKLAKPSRYHFDIVDKKIPMPSKRYTIGKEQFFESAESRFQNNLRWMNGVRDTIRFMNSKEYEQRLHYDIIVRLRDDSFAFGTWLITSSYVGKLSYLKTASFGGINDHNLAIDGKYVDILFRGLIEDYYLNSTLQKKDWVSSEFRIYTLATSYQIPTNKLSLCEQPIIPLRGMINSSYWRIHPNYAKYYSDDCMALRKSPLKSSSNNSGSNNSSSIYKNMIRSCCSDDWIRLFKSEAVSVL